MGDSEGEVELAIPTVQPGETIHTGGRKLLVLDAAYELPDETDFRGFLTVEEMPAR